MDHDEDSGSVASDETKKQVFELLVFSEAGKPIYTFSKRADAVTLMPLCSAFMNYAVKTQKETLKSMRTSNNLEIVFTTRSPLVIVVLYEISSCIDPLVIVDQVEAQIISILTAKTLKSVFHDRPTFDLKQLLYGSEKLIDAIINLTISEVKLEGPFVDTSSAANSSTALGLTRGITSRSSSSPTSRTKAHRVLIPIIAMQPSVRDNINTIVSNAVVSNSKNVVFSLLFKLFRAQSTEEEEDQAASTRSDYDKEEEQSLYRGFKLITVCNHHSRHKLKLPDIHLIRALLDGFRSQLESVESLWMPVCLPRFNQDSFLHSYISLINKKESCLVIFSVDRDDFSNCQSAKNIIESKIDHLYKEGSSICRVS